MPLDRPLQRGEFVVLSRPDAPTVRTGAMVCLASPNGKSLIVLFDGTFGPDDRGVYVGAMSLLQQDDGTFVDLIHQLPVLVERQVEH